MSDDDSDDDLLGYKPITASASLSGKRERVPTKRLVEEVADVDSCSDEDCDLKKLAAKSARAAKRAQKLGFSTDAEYRAQAMEAPQALDWDYINGQRDKLLQARTNNTNSTDVLEDDEDDEDEEGDYEGQVRNVYRGAREVLEQQVEVWPTAKHLVFDYHEAMDENPTRYAPLKNCFLALAHLSEAVAGFTDGLTSTATAASSSSSSMPASPWSAMSPSAATSEMAELLGRPTKNIADLLVAAAAAAADSTPSWSGNGKAIVLPQKLWSWLLDMVVFPSSDLLGHMALIGAKRILRTWPPLPAATHEDATGTAASPTILSGSASSDDCLEVWDPSRPLMFEHCCRPLIALGLDPMAIDPTSSSSAPGRPPKPNQGLRAAAAPRFARPLFPGPALVRCLELWAEVFGEGRHTLSGEECLDVLACVVLVGIDPWALSTRGLQMQKDECLCALLRTLPTSIPSVLPSVDAPRAEAIEDVKNRVWPEATVDRMTQVVHAAAGAEARLLLLRSIPLAANHGRGRVILAKCACDFANEAFPPRRPPSPAVSAVAATEPTDVDSSATSNVEAVSSVEARHVAAASEVANRLLTESNDAYLQRVHGGQASRLAGQGPRALGYLLGTADALIAAASELGELSVPRFNAPMIKLLERVNGFLRMNIDPEVLDLKEYATSLMSKYKPLIADEMDSSSAPKPPRQQTLDGMFKAAPSSKGA